MGGLAVDKIVLIPSAVLGILFVLLYVIRCWKSQTEFNLAVMINSIFQASGIICGCFLIAGIFSEELRKLMAGIDLYILVSGLAVLAVSIQGFYRDAIRNTSTQAEKENANQEVEPTVKSPVDLVEV
jgi:hypothetical protein